MAFSSYWEKTLQEVISTVQNISYSEWFAGCKEYIFFQQKSVSRFLRVMLLVLNPLCNLVEYLKQSIPSFFLNSVMLFLFFFYQPDF